MIRRVLAIAVAVLGFAFATRGGITLERCVELARENYPLISRYGLSESACRIELSDINKSWLPQVGLYGQATVQNAVPSFPDALSEIIGRMGADIPGLDRWQYKVGLDLSQTVWDGGASKSRRTVAEAVAAERKASIDVRLYTVRESVENLFFGILLTEAQISQTEQTRALLESNLRRLRSMKANGTAMQSDVDMVEAQVLTVGQQIASARSAVRGYRRLLGIYTASDLSETELERPSAAMPESFAPARPELGLFEARTRANDARLGEIRASLMPRIGFFAQAYYGYPGFDYFKSMMNRDLSFNILAGLKISWNIGAFYTRGNSERRLRLANEDIAVDRELFMFNTALRTESQTSGIDGLREIMKEDSRIVALRASVRKAAESQLENGVIDATALLTKITDENLAALTARYHEIQLLQRIYQLKYTLNR